RDVVAVLGNSEQHGQIERPLALVATFLEVDDGARLEPIEAALAGDAVLVDPKHRHLRNATLKCAGQMWVERDAARGLAHLAHHVRLPGPGAVPFGHDAE